MNAFGRVVAQIACSQSTSKRFVLHPTALLTRSYSTQGSSKANAVAAAESDVDDWPRPSEIPFQVKVANSVSLIGYVDTPVQFQTSADGKNWAGTVISQNVSHQFPSLWVPVVFEGDLAHIAACHLKKNDHVHISGQLTAEPPPPGALNHANVQVMAQSINFVEESSQTRKHFASRKQEEATIFHSASMKKDSNSDSSPWHDLLQNPEQWWDYRGQKLSGLVNPRHPDFKRKDGSLSLWLNKARGWVLSELESVKFDVQTPKAKYSKKDTGVESDVQIPKSDYGDESWKDLVENPKKWWDNRLEKISKNSPDFKHKETGEGLWLSSAPDWVPPKLPAPRGKKSADSERVAHFCLEPWEG